MAFRLRVLLSAVVLLCLGIPVFADSTSFDLSGPTLEATVTRGKARLPIAEVPNLQAGDRVWIQANFPATQSVRYLMVVVFLRGSTNPPPDNWFHQDETWKHRGSEGLQLTVPKGARQMLVLLAPETGGAYHTLVNAVQHKPGSFVRASQDLNEAMLDRSRLDTYLDSIQKVNERNPAELKTVAPILARSLAIKLNNTCFDAVSEEQAPCLMHSQNSQVLTDSQSESITDTLTSGAVSDLAMQVSATPRAGYGYYSPYIASVMDIARIMSSFHSPQYQYIPALGMRKAKAMHLMLNTPPSFGKQKSVIVAAMPSIQTPQLPLMHVVDSGPTQCAEKPGLVVPVDGAPLVFATKYAHDMMLQLTTKGGKAVELPARVDVEKGGFVVDTKGLDPGEFGDTVEGKLHGLWGFAPYNGPEFTLENVHSQPWMLAAGEADTLVVGHDAVVHLNAGNAVCVEKIAVKSGGAPAVNAQWKELKPSDVEVTLPLKDAQPGTLTLLVHQYGLAQAETVTLHSFAKAAVLKSFTLHAGDKQGMLTGDHLKEVASLEVNGVKFTAENTDAAGALVMKAADPEEYKTLTAGSPEAHVRLKDGRVLTVKATIEARRPEVKLLAKSVELAQNDHSNIQLADANELPQTATLRFSVKAEIPQRFGRNEALEVATADSVFTTTLTMQNGGLTLQDLQTAVATLRPSKAFGESAFGPLQFRVVDKGVAGAWRPLATLVRLPMLKKLKCSGGAEDAPDAGSQDVSDAMCRLTGTNLFLVDAVATDPSFEHEVQVPDGFPGESIQVPQPAKGQLFVKLRDDPQAVNIVALKSAPPRVRPKPKTAPSAAAAGGGKPLPFNPGGPMIPATGPAAQTGASAATPPVSGSGNGAGPGSKSTTSAASTAAKPDAGTGSMKKSDAGSSAASGSPAPGAAAAGKPSATGSSTAGSPNSKKAAAKPESTGTGSPQAAATGGAGN
ncbi:MAG: hypothetical protein ACLGPM_09750 [Acidobacteriota bacterium]